METYLHACGKHYAGYYIVPVEIRQGHFFEWRAMSPTGDVLFPGSRSGVTFENIEDALTDAANWVDAHVDYFRKYSAIERKYQEADISWEERCALVDALLVP